MFDLPSVPAQIDRVEHQHVLGGVNFRLECARDDRAVERQAVRVSADHFADQVGVVLHGQVHLRG